VVCHVTFWMDTVGPAACWLNCQEKTKETRELEHWSRTWGLNVIARILDRASWKQAGSPNKLAPVLGPVCCFLAEIKQYLIKKKKIELGQIWSWKLEPSSFNLFWFSSASFLPLFYNTDCDLWPWPIIQSHCFKVNLQRIEHTDKISSNTFW